MSIDEHKIERRLKGGEVIGLNLAGHIPALGVFVAPQEFGYITIRWNYVSPVTPYDPETERAEYLRWLKSKAERERTPYHIHIAIVREKLKEREHWPAEDFPDNDDYLARENYDVSSIAEIQEIVNQYGKSLADAKPLREMRMP